MAFSIVKREASVGVVRRWHAVAAGLALTAAALGAAAGRLAETPAAATLPALAAIGPGQLGVLRAALGGQESGIPAGLPAKSRAALPGSPLAYEPFVALAADGFRAPGASGSAADAKLLEEAIRRNQRAREARTLLLRHGLANSNLRVAVEQLALLTRLGNPEGHKMIEGLGMAIASPAQVDEAIAAFDAHPELYRDFLLGFSARAKPPATAARLAAKLPAGVTADPYLRQVVLKFLVEAGNYGEARALWQRHSAPAAKGWVYNPEFAASSASPPFNWEFNENEVGAAERSQDGLSIVFYGRESGALASQLITLPAGNWRATIAYGTELVEGGDAGVIVLRVRCAGSTIVIGELPLSARAGNSAKAALAFTVPTGQCPAQLLAVEGVANEARTRQEVRIRRIYVTGGGA